MELSSDELLPPMGAIPLFITTTTRRIFGFHPWRAMQARYIQTTSVVFTGGKNAGKTACALLLMYYTSMLDMGDGRRARMIYDNMRTNDGKETEDVGLLRAYGKDGIRITVKEAHINPFDWRLLLTPSQMLRWTIATVFDLNKMSFDEIEISILGQLIRKMTTGTNKKIACPTLLVQMADEFEVNDYISNIRSRRNKIVRHLGTTEAGVNMLKMVLKSGTDPTTWENRLAISHHPELVTEAATRLAAKLNTALLETGAEIFGDENSLVEIMGEHLYVSQDLTGLDDALASSYHFLVRLYIRNSGRFDIIGQDETSKSWRFASWAASESDEEWQIREYSPLKIRIIQELSLLQMSADANTQQYQMALNSVRGAGVHFIFGGQTESAYEGLREALGMSSLDARWLMSINPKRPGTFGLKPRDGSLIRSQLLVTTDDEMEIISSNSAVARRVGRQSRRARRNLDRARKELNVS